MKRERYVRTSFLVLSFVFILLAKPVNGAGLPFEDSFENIAIGDYPHENGWIPSAIGNMVANVSSNRSFSGAKSLRFTPDCSSVVPEPGEIVCWREDYVPLAEPESDPAPVPVNWRFAIWLGSSGVEAKIYLSPHDRGFLFALGGRLLYSGLPPYVKNVDLGVWEPGKWYDVEVRNRTNQDNEEERIVSVFINGDEVYKYTYPAEEEEPVRELLFKADSDCTGAGEEQVIYLDDVEVCESSEGLPDLVIDMNDLPITGLVIEGEPLEITGKVRNIGNAGASNVRLYLYQYSQYFYAGQKLVGYYSRLNKEDDPGTLFDYIGPGGHRDFSFEWNAVEILNNENKEIEVLVDPPRNGTNVIEESNEDNNLQYLAFNKDILLHEQSYRALVDGFSFPNWPFTGEELIDLRTRIKFLLISAGAGPFTNVILSAVYADSAKRGHCYGMASTSILYSTGRLPKPYDDRAFHLLKEWIAPDIAVNHVKQAPIILARQVAQLAGLTMPTLRESFDFINNAVDADEPVLFNFAVPGPEGDLEGYHSVVAYNCYEESDNIKYVILYDNERPGMGTAVKLDLANNRAVYPEYEKTGHDVFDIRCEFPYLTPDEIITALITLNKEYIDALMENLFSNQQKLLVFQSPVHITIMDENGNVITDKNGGLNQVPGAFFKVDELTKIKRFYLPLDGKYEVYIEGYESGNCIFTVVFPKDESECLLSEMDFNVSASTVARCTLLPGDSSYVLEIDADGDGVIDNTVESEPHEYKAWDYEFVDEKRGTELRLNLTLKQLQFRTKEKDYYPIYDPGICVRKLRHLNIVKVRYSDDDICLLANIIDLKRRDMCCAVLYDKKAKKFALLMVKEE